MERLLTHYEFSDTISKVLKHKVDRFYGHSEIVMSVKKNNTFFATAEFSLYVRYHLEMDASTHLYTSVF